MEIEPELPVHHQSPTILKILVVEDNLTNQKVIVRQLQSLGYEADVAEDGQSALETTATTAYSIILMDCRLPKMDGYTATRLIRQRETQLGSDRRAVIIALTASDDPQVHDQAIAAGMDDFLTKPLRRDKLAATLARWSQLLIATESATRNSPDLHLNHGAALPINSDLWELYFDLAHLHRLSDHNWEFEQELLRLYMDDTLDQLQQLQRAIDRQSLQQIECVAHHIKGASASVGAKWVEQIAERLEQNARQNHLETIHVLMRQLEQAFHQIQTLIHTSGGIISNN